MMKRTVVMSFCVVLAAGVASAQIVNSGIVAVILADEVAPWALATWVGLLWFAGLRCLQSWLRYRRNEPVAEAKPGRLERAVLSSAACGVLWGLPAWAVGEHGFANDLFLLLMVGGMAAGMTASFVSFPAAWANLTHRN